MTVYYLGLEAQVRDNTFYDLDSAIEAAKHVAKIQAIPIRLFEMGKDNKPRMIMVVQKNGEITRTIQEGHGTINNPVADEGMEKVFERAMKRIQEVPEYMILYRGRGVEAALKTYLEHETEHSEYLYKKIKSAYGDLEVAAIDHMR